MTDLRQRTTDTPQSRRTVLLAPSRLGLYAFALAISYLAGVYLGGVLLFVWYTLLLLPILSIIQARSTRKHLLIRQEFVNELPSKGEMIGYVLRLTNLSRLPSAPIHADFHLGLARRGVERRSIYLWSRETRTVEHHVPCTYRGVYTVGLARMTVWDVFGLIGFSLPVSDRTFLLYPRILDLQTAPSSYGNERTVADTPSRSGDVDFSLFRGLRTYQDGDDARHVSWRTLALIGEPLVREYDSAAEPAVTLCMDTRPVGIGGDVELDVEDSVIEASLALTRYYITHGIPVTMVIGSTVERLAAGDQVGFTRVHASMVSLEFDSTLSPASLYDYHRADPAFGDGAVVFVTHRLDPGVIDLVERSDGRTAQAAAILVTSGLHPGDRSAAQDRRRDVTDRAGVLITVDSADALIQELAQWHAESYY